MLKTIIIILVVVVLIAVLGWYVYNYSQSQPEKESGSLIPNLNVSPSVSESLEKMPSTNPLENVANPFEDAYTNPFE